MPRSDSGAEVNPFSPHTNDRPVLDPLETPIVRTEHQESLLTRMIEHQTAKIPSS